MWAARNGAMSERLNHKGVRARAEGLLFAAPSSLHFRALRAYRTHFILKQQIYSKCSYYKLHPKIAWLIESGGSELYDKNKNIILLSLNRLPKTIINISTQK